MLWFVVFCVLCSLIYLKWIKPLYYWKSRGVVFKRPWPIVGNFADVILRRKIIGDLTIDLYRDFPNKRYYGIFQFTVPSLLIKDVDLIKRILVKDFDHFVDHTSVTDPELEPLFSRNLFTLEGQKWRDMRATLSPSFTGNKIKTMFSLMAECAEQFSDHFLATNSDVVELEMKNAMTKYANDVIATCAFGVHCDSLKTETNEFYKMGQEISQFGLATVLKVVVQIVFPSLAKKFKISVLSRKISRFFYGAIKSTVLERERLKIIRPDMIHLLMEARNERQLENEGGLEISFAEDEKPAKSVAKEGISLDDIVAQAFVFFIAGFETVSTTMCFLCHELAENPDVQNKLRNEIDETWEKCDGKLTYESVVKMKYLDMVVSETLRKWSNGQLNRRCTRNYVIEANEQFDEKSTEIEEGVGVVIPVHGLHNDPTYFPNPNRFDPERFSEENKAKIVPYTYMPFGIGPRSCIGSRFALLEMKTLVAHLLRKLELVVVERSVVPLKLSPKRTGLAPENGFWLGLKRRHGTTT